MRMSKDEYILPNGEIIALSQDKQPPKDAKIYNGFDYKNQCWIFEGKKDNRTIKELEESLMEQKIINDKNIELVKEGLNELRGKFPDDEIKSPL